MAMPGYKTRVEAPPEPQGPGVTALVLGLAGMFTFWMCGLGMVLAAVGLVVGAVAVSRGQGRVFGYLGIGVSVLALLIGFGVLAWFGMQAVDCRSYADDLARTQCMEEKFPLLKAHR